MKFLIRIYVLLKVICSVSFNDKSLIWIVDIINLGNGLAPVRCQAIT